MINSNIAEAKTPLQSVAIKWVTDEKNRAELVNDLMTRTEYSDTSPFMDWVEEASADIKTKTLGAYNSDIGQWAGFLAFRTEYKIMPEKPGKARIVAEIQIESVYLTEQERGKCIANVLMEMAIDSINGEIENIKANNMLLKMSVEIAFIADCFSDAACHVATKGLNRLMFLNKDAAVQNHITLVLDEE